MKIYIIRATLKKIDEAKPTRYFATANPIADLIIAKMKKIHPEMEIETHVFDIKTQGKNADNLFEELPF